MSDSKNDIAWLKLFEKYNIVNNVEKNGLFEIQASQINEFREARLMAKFDYKSQLPKIFTDNNLSILPVSRGSYIISTFETFKEFENNIVPVKRTDFPDYIKSIDYHNITSESAALNCAYVSGMLTNFTNDDTLKPTVSGRMSSLSFNFNIDSKKGLLNLSVENSQIEIDGGYEGTESLNIIEAKNSISKDFLIRQLYYPFRLWEQKISKRIRPLFLTYTNGIFHFREYTFEEPGHYNSIKLIRESKYVIKEETITRKKLFNILNEIKPVPEPQIPFPQADSFERIINLCELLNENTQLSRNHITSNYDFDVRQTNYYTDAGRYLGFIEKTRKKGEIIYYLTETGKRLFSLRITERQIAFIQHILSHLVFHKALTNYFNFDTFPDKLQIVKIMKESGLYHIDSESTFQRRASTISSWLNWILSQIDD